MSKKLTTEEFISSSMRKHGYKFRYSNSNTIEYDGELHHTPSKRRNGIKKFNATKTHDALKTEYCIKNDINSFEFRILGLMMKFDIY